jgi:DegV family protein with EDD domain
MNSGFARVKGGAMADYIITTDSTVDLPRKRMDELDIPRAYMSYIVGNSEYKDDMTEKSAAFLYELMRDGAAPTTAQVNTEDFLQLWTPLLERELDIVHVGFSSGLSGSTNSAMMAARDLTESYPKRKIYVVDSLCASGGEGYLLTLALEKQKSGAGASECFEYLENIKLRINHWFTVDDLVYLKRGGRVTPTAAFLANLLSIKPVLNVDSEGHLIPQEKVKGRRAAIKRLFEHMCELAVPDENKFVYITHADCENDALYLKSLIEEKFGGAAVSITMIGAIIGAHAGPGTLALFFLGKEREK